MRRLIANILIVSAVLAPAVACIWAVHKTDRATLVYNRSHYGPAEVQGPPYRESFTMDTPEALLNAAAKAQRNHKPQTRE